MSAVWKVESMSSTQKLVMLALADNANDQGECYPSMTMLARKTCLSDRSVRGTVRDLETAGFVRSEARPGTSTLYHLNVLPRNVVPPTPEGRSGPEPGAAPEGGAALPGTTFPPTPEPHSGDPGTTFPLTITEPSTEPSPNRQPKTSADWISWWRDQHGIYVDHRSLEDRKRFMPLVAQWLQSGITLEQMAWAVAEGQRTAKEPIAFLPSYAWRVLQRNPDRMSGDGEQRKREIAAIAEQLQREEAANARG